LAQGTEQICRPRAVEWRTAQRLEDRLGGQLARSERDLCEGFDPRQRSGADQQVSGDAWAGLAHGFDDTEGNLRGSRRRQGLEPSDGAGQGERGGDIGRQHAQAFRDASHRA